MTIQEQVQNMQSKMAEMRDRTRDDRKHRCYSVLHDAIIHTGPRIENLTNDSLLGYIELAAATITDQSLNDRALRNKLIAMGFNTAPVN